MHPDVCGSLIPHTWDPDAPRHKMAHYGENGCDNKKSAQGAQCRLCINRGEIPDCQQCGSEENVTSGQHFNQAHFLLSATEHHCVPSFR